MPPEHTRGEVIGRGSKYGVQIGVVRTPYGEVRIIPGRAADAFTNPEAWAKIIGHPAIGAAETKPNRAMMGAEEMRRYLRGRDDL